MKLDRVSSNHDRQCVYSNQDASPVQQGSRLIIKRGSMVPQRWQDVDRRVNPTDL
ncbi:hypothetical protein [Prochlorothrix hollandica]|uniref:hypothetical protein n=1 Tax=Prochlorothrix hollandica TaxID=1223 RepID=UPI0012B56203|nr:hypothetical protein [Prochlorothrix hollandica]